MKIVKIALLFSLLVGVVLSACQPAPPVDTPPVDDDYVYGKDAVVESVDVLLLESFPLQARAVVTGYLPDGCTELVAVNVDRQDDVFLLRLDTRRPAGDVVCTMVLQLIEESVTLDIAGLPAGTYTVIAQDQQAQFTLDVDN
jgi:inhibitor of cysteine peptidase